MNSSFDRQIDVCFAQTKWMDANMCATLAAMLFSAHSTGRKISFNNMSPELSFLFARNKFSTIYGIPNIVDTAGTTIPYRHFTATTPMLDFLRYADQELLGTRCFPMVEANLRKQLLTNLTELYDNSQIHSRTTTGIHACGQFFPQKKCSKITISDAGIGIQQGVSNWFNRPMSGVEAIKWALLQGNSTKSGNTPGGLGLSVISNFININRGKLIICSGNGYCEINQGVEILHTLPYNFVGTTIALEVNTQA